MLSGIFCIIVIYFYDVVNFLVFVVVVIVFGLFIIKFFLMIEIEFFGDFVLVEVNLNDYIFKSFKMVFEC